MSHERAQDNGVSTARQSIWTIYSCLLTVISSTSGELPVMLAAAFARSSPFFFSSELLASLVRAACVAGASCLRRSCTVRHEQAPPDL
jgi:hypothetical protein